MALVASGNARVLLLLNLWTSERFIAGRDLHRRSQRSHMK
jgi:hypothetical protein